MANDLTGDFDIVAEFAIPAANRVLASMHWSERFPHSLSVRVDDTPPPPGPGGLVGPRPTVVASIDAFGDPTTNHRRIGDVDVTFGGGSGPNGGPPPSSSPSVLDDIVNIGDLNLTVVNIEIVPSNLKGRAQLQLFPPTLTVPDATGTKLTVRIQLMARYTPDANTAPLAEFIHGELQMTAAFNQVAAQSGHVLEIDVKAQDVGISFTPFFSSRALSSSDLAGINLCIRNALRTSFLPSNATLPSSIGRVQFKTLAGSRPALAVLLNMGSTTGNPASAHNVFLGANDGFAFAAGVDFVRATFQPTLDNILATPIDPVKFDVDTLVHTFHITYTITLNTATVDLESGLLVLKITGHAHTGTSWMPDFDFTVRQEFSLVADGDTANLVVGDLSFDTSSWVVDLFKGAAVGPIRKARDRALAQSHATSVVRQKLSASGNLGSFLDSLLNSPRDPSTPRPPGFRLAYTNVEIRPAGIILHGTVSVPEFSPAHIEFEEIPSNGLADNTVFSGPHYSALKTWIPGGTIDRFEWRRLGESQALDIETHKFVMDPQPVITADTPAAFALGGFHPLCLSIHGTRLSASGPIVAQPVTASACDIQTFPIATGTIVSAASAPPLVAVTHAGPQGTVTIAGHTRPRTDPSGKLTPNLLVHFADDNSIGHLQTLDDAVRKVSRPEAATAILAVMTPDQIKKARFVPTITYAEDQDGAWEKLFGLRVARRPATLLLGQGHKVAWQHEGALDGGKLTDGLRTHLTPRKMPKSGIAPIGARVGQRPPNIVFEIAPGRQITLRKLAGRSAILVFWKSASKVSIDAVRDVLHGPDARGANPAVVLAVRLGRHQVVPDPLAERANDRVVVGPQTHLQERCQIGRREARERKAVRRLFVRAIRLEREEPEYVVFEPPDFRHIRRARVANHHLRQRPRRRHAHSQRSRAAGAGGSLIDVLLRRWRCPRPICC